MEKLYLCPFSLAPLPSLRPSPLSEGSLVGCPGFGREIHLVSLCWLCKDRVRQCSGDVLGIAGKLGGGQKMAVKFFSLFPFLTNTAYLSSDDIQMLSVLSLVKDKHFQEQVTWKTKTPSFSLPWSCIIPECVLTCGLQGVE